MSERTPAQLYALVFGFVLLLAGVIGFFFDGGTSFAVGEAVEGERGTLVLFDINGWLNLVHLASGAVGLAVAASPPAARAFAIGFGIVYALLTLLGIALESPILGLVPINGADNVLHLLIALVGIAAGLATPREPAPTTT